ncbi:hypothetical protein BKA56DRAFT_732422 [Ilyonectria sp. MPI-CAGE-AT-0026]|nr:hypothetical protein BKA56DRAFT_732422 [Ilyonectria sp. MPI-CAGE-AT-0026]
MAQVDENDDDVEKTIYGKPERGEFFRKPFTGKCRICQKKGHKALECPVRAWQLRQAPEEKEKDAEDPNGEKAAEKAAEGGEDVAMS